MVFKIFFQYNAKVIPGSFGIFNLLWTGNFFTSFDGDDLDLQINYVVKLIQTKTIYIYIYEKRENEREMIYDAL
jgi:hypothetical protein